GALAVAAALAAGGCTLIVGDPRPPSDGGVPGDGGGDGATNRDLGGLPPTCRIAAMTGTAKSPMPLAETTRAAVALASEGNGLFRAFYVGFDPNANPQHPLAMTEFPRSGGSVTPSIQDCLGCVRISAAHSIHSGHFILGYVDPNGAARLADYDTSKL